MRIMVIIASTVGICLIVILAYLSVESSKQARRDHDRREMIRQFDEEQKRETAEQQAKQMARRREHSVEETRPTSSFGVGDEDTQLANLKSSDREVLNSAIQTLSIHHVCRAVPDLVDILKSTRDDYIAGIAAEAIVACKQPTTYPVVVEEFLSRSATPASILAVGEIGSQDDRVYAKLHKLITEPNSDPLVPKFAIHAQQQIDYQTQLGVSTR